MSTIENDGKEEGDFPTWVKTEIEDLLPSDSDQDTCAHDQFLPASCRPTRHLGSPRRSRDAKQNQVESSKKTVPSKREKRISQEEKGEKWKQEKEDNDAKSPGRPMRQASLIWVVKEEPDSAEEDNDDFADPDYKLQVDQRKDFKLASTKSSKSSKSRTSSRKNVASEASTQKAQMRAKPRSAKRAGKSGPVKIEEDQDCDGGAKKKAGGRKSKRGEGSKGSSASSGRSGSGGSRKKRVDEMTEEERKAIKEKWREQGRRKRERQRYTKTPQQREEENEKRRLRRALARQTRTDEQREEENRKARERKRARRERMTPQEKKEQLQKLTIWRMGKLATMSEDEKRVKKMSQYLQVMARMASLPPEELERRRLRRLEYMRQRKEKMTAEQLERMKQMKNSYRKNMTPEKRARYLEKLKENHKRNYAKLKENPEKWEKMRERWREYFRRRRLKMIEMGENYMRRTSSEIPKRKAAVSSGRESSNKTPEQIETIREKRIMCRRRCGMKHRIRRNLTIQKLLDDGMSLEEIQQQIEPPERRQRRLIQIRIRKAKLNLRKRLQCMGAPPEEIQKRLEELQQTYQPTYQFRPYKPRPEAWKPIDQSDLALLEETRKNANHTSATAPSSPTLTLVIPPERETPQPKTVDAPNTPPTAEKRARFSDMTCSSISVVVIPESCNQFASQFQLPVQSYSLQHVLVDSLTCQEGGAYAAPVVGAVVTVADNLHPHAYQQDSSSSQLLEYCSSYDNHSPPPPSPGGGIDEFNLPTVSSGNLINNRPPQPSGPKKDPQSLCQKQARGAKSSKPTTVCDECGKAYAHMYKHKLYYHNPNYRDRKCQLCGEEFKLAASWHTHYLHAHRDAIPRPATDPKKKPHMCDICGMSFGQRGNLYKHKYYSHGDGLKKENWNRCPLCPERLFKERGTFYDHLRKKHPGYRRGDHDCYRCENSFDDEKQLSGHVQQEHPDSFFPCPYCNACRFTRVGLNFHFRRCGKVGKELREEMLVDPETFSWDREPLPCEVCNKTLTIGALSRHYLEMHSVKEEEFTCPHCDKGFKKRDFWAVHMQEKHFKSLEEMKEMVRRLNVKSREGLLIHNPEGKRIVVRKKSSKKAREQTKIESRGKVGGGRRKRWSKKETRGYLTEKNPVQKRRKVIVIAEEDEQLILGGSGNVEQGTR